MLADIIKRLSPSWEERTKGPPRFIIVHATVGKLASALGWLCNPRARVSAHYVIAKDGRIFLLVDEDKTAWHCGKSSWRGLVGLNEHSIGIELENRNDGKDPYPEVQVSALVRLVADIAHRNRIPVDRQHIVGHYEISPGRKTDPRGLDLWRVVVEASRLLNG